MARPQKQSRIVKWRGRWTLFYHDYQTGKECRESVHSLTEEQRRTLLARHRQADKNQQAEVIQRGGMLAYDTDLVHALAEHYLTDVAEREAARAENPEAREGIARRSAIDIRASMRMFTGWLNQKHPRLQTGSLDGAKLKSYFSWLARQDTKRGTKTVKMSGQTWPCPALGVALGSPG